ncbi:MAG: hypothetical protein AB7O97_21945 [Planctomycetota bacterium]
MTTRSTPRMVVQAALVLERMAFVIAEPTDQDPLAAIAACSHCAWVRIGERDDGFVVVAAAEGFVREVAAGMLGLEPDEVALDDHGDATVLELANVLGGHLIHEQDGDLSPLRLHLPEAVTSARAGELITRALGLGGFAGVIAAEHGILVLAGTLPRQG